MKKEKLIEILSECPDELFIDVRQVRFGMTTYHQVSICQNKNDLDFLQIAMFGSMTTGNMPEPKTFIDVKIQENEQRPKTKF